MAKKSSERVLSEFKELFKLNRSRIKLAIFIFFVMPGPVHYQAPICIHVVGATCSFDGIVPFAVPLTIFFLLLGFGINYQIQEILIYFLNAILSILLSCLIFYNLKKLVRKSKKKK